MTFPEVDRLRRDQKPHPVRGEHHDESPIARTISASLVAVVAPSSRIVTWPTATSMGPKGRAADGHGPSGRTGTAVESQVRQKLGRWGPGNAYDPSIS